MHTCEGKCKTGKQCTFQASVFQDEQRFCKIHAPCGECSICLDTMSSRNKLKLSCDHVIHTSCIQKWVRKGSSSCPLCRKELTKDEITKLCPEKDYEKKQVYNISIHQIESEQLLQMFDDEFDDDYLQRLMPSLITSNVRNNNISTPNMLTITILSTAA